MNDQNNPNPTPGVVNPTVTPAPADPSVVNPTTTSDQMAPVGSVAPAVTTQVPDLGAPVATPTTTVVPEPTTSVVSTPTEQPVTVQPTETPGGDTGAGTPPPAPTV